MSSPYRAEAEIIKHVPGVILLARVRSFDITIANNWAKVPATGFDLGTIQLIDVGSAALSTGVVTWAVSNDPDGGNPVVIAGATTQSAAGSKYADSIEHLWFGPLVTSIQGSPGDSTVRCDALICLRKWI